MAPEDKFVWADFWQHDLIIMLNPCSSCLYTNSFAIQVSILFVILKSGWYIYCSNNFSFDEHFQRITFLNFPQRLLLHSASGWVFSNSWPQILLFPGLLESYDMTAGGDNAFFLMCIHCVVGFMVYILCLLPRRLLLRGRWNQRRGIFVMCNGSISVKDVKLGASLENQ